MNDREKWRERVRDIRHDDDDIYIYIYIYIYIWTEFYIHERYTDDVVIIMGSPYHENQNSIKFLVTFHSLGMINETINVQENGIGEPCSNPGRSCLRFREFIRSPFSYCWIEGQAGFFSLDKAINLKEGKLLIQASVYSALKLTLGHIVFVADRLILIFYPYPNGEEMDTCYSYGH